MTKNNISDIFGFIRDAFGDSATKLANIYRILCNSGRRGVVDTIHHWCMTVPNKLRNFSFSFFFFFFLYFTLEFLYQLWLKIIYFLLFFFFFFFFFLFFHTKKKKKKNS